MFRIFEFLEIVTTRKLGCSAQMQIGVQDRMVGSQSIGNLGVLRIAKTLQSDVFHFEPCTKYTFGGKSGFGACLCAALEKAVLNQRVLGGFPDRFSL